jgi:hypothetical protein
MKLPRDLEAFKRSWRYAPPRIMIVVRAMIVPLTPALSRKRARGPTIG